MMTIRPLAALLAFSLGFAACPGLAQDAGTLDPKPLPPLANPNDPKVPAKELFGRKDKPASLQPLSIGGYAKGCVAGAAGLPIDGETWQVMRLSRNRNWGHPRLVDFLERLSRRVPGINGWPGCRRAHSGRSPSRRSCRGRGCAPPPAHDP